MNSLPTTTQRLRAYLRLTLGGLMIAVLIVGGGLGWIAHRVKVQRVAVAAILRGERGVVYYDWRYRDGRVVADGKPKGPKWLRDLLGNDVFDDVVLVALRGDKLDDELMEQVAKLDRIRHLYIQGGRVLETTAEGMAKIRFLPRLEVLVVQGPIDSSGFLAGLAGTLKLKRLWLQQAMPSDADMIRIGRLIDLEELMVNAAKVTDVGFARLANLKKLKRLEFSGPDITNIAPLSELVALQQINLEAWPFAKDDVRKNRDPIDVSPLVRAKRLQNLILGRSVANDGALEPLKDLPLHQLSVNGAGITNHGLALFAEMPKLKALWLKGTSISELRLLGPALPRIVNLVLRDSPLTDAGLQPISAATKLRALMLTGTKITDDGLKYVVPLSLLSSLQLDDTAITDAGLGQIAKMTTLSELFLDNTAITDAGLAKLSGLTRLQTLSIVGTHITDAAIPDLQKLTLLKVIRVYGTKLSDAGLAKLQKALPGVQIAAVNPRR